MRQSQPYTWRALVKSVLNTKIKSKRVETFGAEKYENIFINSGFETYTTSGLDITEATNTFITGVAYDNIALSSAKKYKITFDYTALGGTEPYYRVANDAGLTSLLFNQQMSGTGSYEFESSGAAYHGFINPSFPPCSFAVANLSVKEIT